MFSNKLPRTHFVYKFILIAAFACLVCACERKSDDDKITSNLTNSEVPTATSEVKAGIEPDCAAPTGNAMEDGEVHVCRYNTDSLAQVYELIVQENAAKNENVGYALLKKSLPSKDLEDKFDVQETWIKYTWLDKDHVTIKIQMAGGEDTIELTKENHQVKVTTTLSAD